jgi:tRNA G26 N,N-dimethylase Trm1
MIPIYLYLSIYSYSYACSNYDILVAPLLNYFIEYHADLINQVERERNRLKVLEQHGKIKPGEIEETEFMTKFQRMVYTTFNVDNMYLLK